MNSSYTNSRESAVNGIILQGEPSLVSDGRLEAIVKYSDGIEALGGYVESVEILSNNYAIVTGTLSQINSIYSLPFIEYVELPKTLSFELSSSRYSVCSTRAQGAPFNLSGKGVAIGIIDSGIDFTHPDFQNNDGTSRILYLWDQTANGTPPYNFKNGAEYTNGQINDALKSATPFQTVNSVDEVGHGTAVTGIAAGNGRQSDGRERGIAPDSPLIIVKLGRRGNGAFPRTTEVMRALRYIIDRARENALPVCINISYGTNNGSHDGNSLFEQYINEVSLEWKTVICVATGNEGDAAHHFSSVLSEGGSVTVPIVFSGGVNRVYVTLWKNFSDSFNFSITSPTNEISPVISPLKSLYRFTLSNTDITVFYGQPTNYTQYQEVYFLFESQSASFFEGIWNINVFAETVVDGKFDLWLPPVSDVFDSVTFSTPDINVTLTLPSTVENVISVAGYNSNNNSIAAFSGRGYTRNNVKIKPDIAAPAVNILTTKAGGGYMQFSGTSFACPFVTGACALMMEWGITRGNDIFLYGQRVKAFLQKGAKRLQNVNYPNNYWGYGTLCISNSLDLLVSYNQGGSVI